MDNSIGQQTKSVELASQKDIEQETNILFNGKKVYCIYKTFSNKNRGTYSVVSGASSVVGFGGSGSLGASQFKGPWNLQAKDPYGNSWSFYVSGGTLYCKYDGSTSNWDGGSWTCWVLYTKD